jgi:ferredoxin
MAIIRFEEEEREVADGSNVMEACEDMGLPFGCTDGICGTCMSVPSAGAFNLESMTEKELDFDLPKGQRLACQCVIKGGEVEFILD